MGATSSKSSSKGFFGWVGETLDNTANTTHTITEDTSDSETGATVDTNDQDGNKAKEEEEEAEAAWRCKKLDNAVLIKHIFSKHAENDCAFVDARVISSLLQKLNIEDTTIIASLAHHFDYNKDGIYDYAEFFAFMNSLNTIYKAFSEGDKNLDRVLSVQEMMTVLSEDMKKPLSEVTINKLLDKFDTNGDRMLDYGEFLLLYIFLQELKKVYDKFETTQSIAANDLCELIDNNVREETAARELKKVFGDYSIELNINSFACLLLFYKAKINPPRMRIKQKKHVHLSLCNAHGWKINNKILSKKLEDKVLWRDIRTIQKDINLFVNGIDQTDVIQGNLTDCWFIGALAVLAATNNLTIRNLFVAEDPINGYYRCRFFKEGAPKEVDVDTLLPYCKEAHTQLGNHLLYFASCKTSSEIWVPIIEKAYATMHGSYEAIKRGDFSEALKDLTGGATQTIFLKPSDVEKQWQMISNYHEKNCLMGCALEKSSRTPKEDEEIGIISQHAYSISKCVVIGKTRLLQLRNPWGHTEWKGAWSDTSKNWNIPEAAKYLETYERVDDGIFHMSIEDFLLNFDRLYVLHQHLCNPRCARGEWVLHKTAFGCNNNPYWYCNPRYSITTTEEDAFVVINLSQADLRHDLGMKMKPGNYSGIGMYLIKPDGDPTKLEIATLVTQSEAFTETRDVGLSIQAKTPTTYVLIPTTFDPDVNIPFHLEVYSDKLVRVEEIKSREFQKRDGRCGKNPERFWLRFSETGNVDFIFAPLLPHNSPNDPPKSFQMKINIEYENEEEKYVHFCKADFTGRSMCISRTLQANVLYLIELSIATEEQFEIFVFSNSISHFAKFRMPEIENLN